MVLPNAPSRPGNKGFSGEPLGDFVGKSTGGDSKMLAFTAGAETANVEVQLMYQGTGAPGRINWAVGDLEADRVLVEDLARRILGRMLAWQHFQAVRNGTLSSSATEVTDSAGTRYVSVASWVASQGGVSTAERSVGRRFTHNSRPILVLTGADKVKIGVQWVAIGGYAVEVNNKPFVPIQGFVAALN